MTRALLSKRARDDLTQATRWIARDNPTAAKAFRSAIARAAEQIADHPKSGTERPDLANPPARFLVVRGFRYVIVYDTDTKPPTILRILHGARELPAALQEE